MAQNVGSLKLLLTYYLVIMKIEKKKENILYVGTDILDAHMLYNYSNYIFLL